MMILPFEVEYEEMIQDLEPYVSAVFSSLASDFLAMPRGNGFVDFAVFEQGYEMLKQVTVGFYSMDPDAILEAAKSTPIILIVLRSILGFTPPEWAYIATQRTGVEVSQGAARALDRNIRLTPEKPLPKGEQTFNRVKVLIKAACQLIDSPFPEVEQDKIHRLDKADTRHGLAGLRNLAGIGVPYSMLLYERFLGRPFAGHRDSVSDLIGDSLESAIEDILVKSGISFRKTKRAEKIAGFDQTPDFIIPSEFNPQVVIEAKITEDDGTARDKVTRIQHLGELSSSYAGGSGGFEVIACIGGRGFGVRREDMKKMLLATKGKVFTLQNLDRLVECTRLQEFTTIKDK